VLTRLIGRFRRSSEKDVAQRELERAEAAKLKDELITDRAYVRFGPRNSVPDEQYDE
jgi:hypothetical protein